MINILASYNKNVDKVFMTNISQNAKYIYPIIQKEIFIYQKKKKNFHVFTRRIKMKLEKVSTMKFFDCVNEALVNL
jgi:hypothetical protein